MAEHPREHTELIIDIGSASVGACFSTGAPGLKPVLSYVKRVNLGSRSEAGRSGIQEFAIKALKEAVAALPSAPVPERVRVVLAAPWYAAEAKIIVSDSEKPLRIGRATVHHAIGKHRSEEAKTVRAGRRSIESLVSRIYVNGYATELRKTVRGKNLAIHLYESEGDAAFIESVENILKDAFPHAARTFHTFPFVSFIALRSIEGAESFVFIDAGGEVSDILIASGGDPAFLSSFPEGTQTFIRRAADGGSLADASSRLTLFAKGQLSGEEASRFSETFSAIAASWNGNYDRVLDAASMRLPMPRMVFIASDKEPLSWFERVFSLRSSPSSSRPVLLMPDFFAHSVTLGDDAVFDAFLSLEALSFGTEKESLE